MIENILFICLGVAVIGLILSIIFQKEEVETKYCPKCGSKVKKRFSKIGDIALGITPMVAYKKCNKCGWTN